MRELQSLIELCIEKTLIELDRSDSKGAESNLKNDDNSVDVFINIETNEDMYMICKYSRFYKKFYISKTYKNRIFTLGQIVYPGNRVWDDAVMCLHTALFSNMWSPLQEKFHIAAKAIKDLKPEAECLQKIGQFLFLYINIMPYRKGSAAIGEWLMRGFFHARGIDLGNLNQEMLSWDFSAFAYLSAEEYGEKFEQFFCKN